jgi:hypothetical protein
MSESQRITKVNVGEDVKFGLFANAFRVVEEVGPDCFLDFMVYSAAEKEATVVSRVRVRREFVPSIRETLSEAMEEFPGDEGNSASQDAALRKNGETVH